MVVNGHKSLEYYLFVSILEPIAHIIVNSINVDQLNITFARILMFIIVNFSLFVWSLFVFKTFIDVFRLIFILVVS